MTFVRAILNRLLQITPRTKIFSLFKTLTVFLQIIYSYIYTQSHQLISFSNNFEWLIYTMIEWKSTCRVHLKVTPLENWELIETEKPRASAVIRLVLVRSDIFGHCFKYHYSWKKKNNNTNKRTVVTISWCW